MRKAKAAKKTDAAKRARPAARAEAQDEGLAELRAAVKGKTVTLLTATRELDLSHATVLKELLT